MNKISGGVFHTVIIHGKISINNLLAKKIQCSNATVKIFDIFHFTTMLNMEPNLEISKYKIVISLRCYWTVPYYTIGWIWYLVFRFSLNIFNPTGSAHRPTDAVHGFSCLGPRFSECTKYSELKVWDALHFYLFYNVLSCLKLHFSPDITRSFIFYPNE